MNRSRHKVDRRGAAGAPTCAWRPGALQRLPIASAVAAALAAVPVVHAQESRQAGALEEVVVTAQKRSENLQDVPLAIVALGTQKLEELHITNLDDYVKFLPSVSYVRGQGQGGNGQPGITHVYMRGVVSGGDGNHSGSQPSVGTYLDEQPVTTIDGTVDVHVYDIERVEVLEGPQGTLYGASSQAGTIRIITNKPDPKGFRAGYDAGVNSVNHGGVGYVAEGFVNLPLSPVAAVRLVGWDEHDAGYINNVAGSNASACIVNGVRTFPGWSGQYAQGSGYPGSVPPNNPWPCPAPTTIGAGSISNAAYVQNHYNTVSTKGGRGALRVNLGDNWSVTPTLMGQSVDTEGFFAFDPALGDLQVTHFGPENSQDSWLQAALTVEGKVSDFDMVYAGAFMKRTTHAIADYSDYSLFYDRLYGSGSYWQANNGTPIMPQELVVQKGYFQKWSHELRVSTPQDLPLKATAGLFVQRQLHDIWQQYTMPGFGFTNPSGGGNPNGFADSLTISGLSNTIWLTSEQRVDRDQAVFAQLTWDINSQWALSGGLRYFKTDNTLQGFYGYSLGYHNLIGYTSGEFICFEQAIVPNTPCTDLDKRGSQSGHVPRVNLAYKVTPEKMVYGTFSKGFRPGGVNRTAQAGIGPYAPDYLTNYEIGWKTQWLGHRLRWNGALFWEEWKDFQFSFLGPNSVTIITNGGQARIKGIESDLEWAATGALTLSSNFTLLDPKLTQDYCGSAGVISCPSPGNPFPIPFAAGGPALQTGPYAPAGTTLPVAPKFKDNLIARYGFPLGSWSGNVQAAFVYQTKTAPLLRRQDQTVIGMLPAYGLFDLSGGLERNGLNIQLIVTNVMDRRAQLTRFVQCTVNVCEQPYVIPTQPRTIMVKFGQRF